MLWILKRTVSLVRKYLQFYVQKMCLSKPQEAQTALTSVHSSESALLAHFTCKFGWEFSSITSNGGMEQIHFTHNRQIHIHV